MKWNKICNMKWGGGVFKGRLKLFRKFNRFGDVIRPKGKQLDFPNSEELFLKAQLGCSHPSKNQVPRSLLSFLKTEWFYLAFTFCHCSAMVCPGNITKCISDLRVGGFCQSNCPNAEQLQQVKNKLWPNNRDWFVSTAFPKGSCNILSSEFPPLKVAPYPHNGKCWCQKISRIERYPNP